jgi:N-formylglutamate amidohydrolase
MMQGKEPRVTRSAPPDPLDQNAQDPHALSPALSPAAFAIVEPDGAFGPLVLSSPHSGASYPPAFIAASRLSALTLRRSEDAFVDELFAGCRAHGAPMLKALFPRAYVDVNREPYELDPRMFAQPLPAFANTASMRVAAGLGTIPRIVSEGLEIHRKPLDVAEALERIERLYKPYHRALRDLLARARARHGAAVLLDCHSMPTPAAHAGFERHRPDVVIGDRYGGSCDPDYTDCLESALRALGYRVQRNKPYAGGYITEHFGAASRACDAVQIEVSRALYMDERRIEKAFGFASLARDMTRVVGELAALAVAKAKAGAARDGAHDGAHEAAAE